MRKGLPATTTVGFLSVVFLSSPAWTQEDSSQRVREAIDRFAAACKAKDINAIMKSVDVPFHYDKDKIIRGREELRRKLKADAEAAVDGPPFPYRVERVQRYKEFRATLDDEVQRKLLDEALGADGWVAFLKVRRPGETNAFSADGTFSVTLLVRVRAGRGMVVGEYIYRRATSRLPVLSPALCRYPTSGARGGA
jgi:hypothetical protein